MYAEAFRDPPCPMCDSEDVRWRGRRPYDFLFTWLRWFAELLISTISPRPRGYRTDEEKVREELAETNTGRKTPKRFWRCRACKRRGYEFEARRAPGS